MLVPETSQQYQMGVKVGDSVSTNNNNVLIVKQVIVNMDEPRLDRSLDGYDTSGDEKSKASGIYLETPLHWETAS